MRVTSKGQVTIPQEIREALGLFPNTEVKFSIENGVACLRKADEKNGGRGRHVVDRLRGSATVRMSTEEILALTR